MTFVRASVWPFGSQNQFSTFNVWKKLVDACRHLPSSGGKQFSRAQIVIPPETLLCCGCRNQIIPSTDRLFFSLNKKHHYLAIVLWKHSFWQSPAAGTCLSGSSLSETCACTTTVQKGWLTGRKGSQFPRWDVSRSLPLQLRESIALKDRDQMNAGFYSVALRGHNFRNWISCIEIMKSVFCLLQPSFSVNMMFASTFLGMREWETDRSLQCRYCCCCRCWFTFSCNR